MVALCIAAAVVYGVLHDLVTAHICVEYFSLGHPNPLDLHDPILLAFFWGVVATWWMGAILGVVFACFSRVGSLPPLGWFELVPKVCLVLLIAAILAVLTGFSVFLDDMASTDFDRRYKAVSAAHNMSYGATIFFSSMACSIIIRQRRRVHLEQHAPASNQVS